MFNKAAIKEVLIEFLGRRGTQVTFFCVTLLMLVTMFRPSSAGDTFAAEPRAETESVSETMLVTAHVNGGTFRREAQPDTTVEDFMTILQRQINTALIYDGVPDRVLTDGEEINFSVWHSETEVTTESVPYLIELRDSRSLSVGAERVSQEGIPGERRTEETVIFIDGEEVSREVTASEFTPPTSRVIDRGIGGALGTLTDTSCSSFHYTRRLTMNASAYTSGFSCTGKRPGDPGYGITASGRRVERGVVAVDRNVIPLGTRLYVDGYGFAIAADVGGAIRGYKIDLFMYTLEEARRFGRRDITVWVLD